MKPLLDALSIILAGVAHVVAGISVVGIGRVYARHFDETAWELPLISRAMVGYTATAAPIVAGIGLGLVSLIGLLLVLRSERYRCWMAFLIAASFIVVLIHLLFVAFGGALPFLRITYTMGNQ